MSRRCVEFVLATALALIATTRPTGAQSYGTELPFVVGSGARSSGLGVAAVTLCDDPSVQYYNPSGLSYLQWKEFVFYRTTLFDSKSAYHALSYAHPLLNHGTIAVSLLRVDTGGIEERDPDNQLLSTDLHNAQTRLLVGYARNITASIAAGVNVKFDNQSFGSYSASGAGMDIGVLATQNLPDHSFVKAIRAGFAVRNVIEPSLKLDREKVADPMDLAFGVSAVSRLGDLTLVTSFDVLSPRESPLDFRFGQEVSYDDHLALRVGFDDVTPTFGVGARFRQFALDYAFRSEEIGDNHRISLAVRFGASVQEQRARAREELEAEVDTELTSRMAQMERAHIARALDEADSLYSTESYNQAADRYETVLLWNPENGQAKERLADSRYRHALSLAEEALADENYVEGIFYSNRGLSFAPRDSAATAIAARCNERIKAAENSQALLTELMKTSIDLYAERRFAEALTGFEQALVVAPNARLAIEYAEKCRMNIEGAVRQCRANADERAARGDYHGAIAALESALEYKPDDPAILVELEGYKRRRDGIAAAGKKTVSPLPSATTVGTDAVEDKTLDESYRKGMTLFNAGDFEGAIGALLKVWTARPDYYNVSDLLAKAYMFVGMGFYSENKYEKAIETWQKALNVDPSNDKAKRYLSKAEEELQKLRGVSSAR
jgi:tetratricopeptide (TPR) repeat protein